MKNYIVLIFFTFFLCENYAQEIQFNEEIINSFRYVNQAELAICKNNFKQAIDFYDSAFTLVNSPKFKDLHNAALCQLKKGNTASADSIFNYLAYNGYYEQIMFCANRTENSVTKREIKLGNGEDLSKVLNKIYNDDQNANLNRFNYTENYYHVVMNNLDKIMSLQKEIKDLFTLDVENKLWLPMTHYFQLMGISEQVKKDSLFCKKNPRYGFLKHINFEKHPFHDFLKEQVAIGNYDRYTYIQFLSYIAINTGFLPISQYDQYIIVRSPDVICLEDLQEVNKIRKQYELESYEDYFIKARYTDSLITKGKPFTSLDFNEYTEMMEEYYYNCNFQLVENYRNMMGFTKPEDAKNVYERKLKRLCK